MKMKNFFILMTMCVLMLVFVGCGSEDGPPDIPEETSIAAGNTVPTYFNNPSVANAYGFKDQSKGSQICLFGFEAGYTTNTWKYQKASNFSISIYVDYDRGLAFDTGNNAVFARIDKSSNRVSSPDGKRTWYFIGATYISPQYGTVLIPTYSDEGAGATVISETYEKSPEGGGNEGGDKTGDWEKKIKATYHYGGDNYFGYEDFTYNVTIRYEASTGKYYLYEPYFYPDSNKGKGLRYDAEFGYNSIRVYSHAEKDYIYGVWHTYDVYCRFTISD